MFSTTTTTILFGLAAIGSTSAAPTSNNLEARASYDGTATYYYQGGNAGSCGDWHADSDYIVAVNSDQQNGSCGKKIKVTNTKTGKTATALAADTCPTCDYGSLDMSEGLFTFLGDGDMGQGEFPISWHYTSD